MPSVTTREARSSNAAAATAAATTPSVVAVGAAAAELERTRQQLEESRASVERLEEEAATLRRVVGGAVSAGRREVTRLPPEQLREEVRRLRYDCELVRLREAIASRQAMGDGLDALHRQNSSDVAWARGRLHGRIAEVVVGRSDAAAVEQRLLRAMEEEMGALELRLRRAHDAAARELRSQVLATQPNAALKLASTAGTAMQRRWLQAVCEQLFPRCLVCVFDPSSATEDAAATGAGGGGDGTRSAWSVLSPDVHAHVGEDVTRAMLKFA